MGELRQQPNFYQPKLTTDEFLLHRSFFEKRRVSKLKTCNDPNRGLTKCLVCATTTQEITYRCDHCLRLFHPSCWDILSVPTRLWFCSLKCEEHMLLAGSMSTCLPGVNEHISNSAVPAAELRATLDRKRRLENPNNPAAKRGKGAMQNGSRSPINGMDAEDFDDGDDDSIKTINSSKDGEDTEGCATSVKALITRYTTPEVPCYLCGTRGCPGHSPEEVRDKLFARRTRAKRLKQLRTQCIKQVQQQKLAHQQKFQQFHIKQERGVHVRSADPDANIRRKTEEGIQDIVSIATPGMTNKEQQRMSYNIRMRVTRMVEDVLKEYKSKIELQFQNTYRKQAKNIPLYQQKLQSNYMNKQKFTHSSNHSNGMIPACNAHHSPVPMHQPYVRQTNGYRRPSESNSRSPDSRAVKQKSVPFTNTPSPSMSPETQPRPPSTRSYTSDSSKRRTRPVRDTKPIIPMLPTSREHVSENMESGSRGPPTSLRENSHEVEASYLSLGDSTNQKGRFNEIDFSNMNSTNKEIETKNDGSRLDVWGSSPLPLPPSNAQTEANLLAHNVRENPTNLLQGMTNFPTEPSSFEIQNGRDLLKN